MRSAHIAGFPIVLPDHREAFHRVNPDWHTTWLHSIHEHLKPDSVVVDVGVEQGDLSALIASWVPDGGIVLVEPVAGFWPTIRSIFEANGLPAPLASFVGFVGSETVYPFKSDVNQWPSESFDSVIPDPGFQHLNERADLPRLKLDDWLDLDESPDAILIDVEGAEFHVLQGAKSVLFTNPLVWCAIHPEIMQQRYSHTPNELLRYMKGLGYRWELLDFAGEIHVLFLPEP